MKKDTTPIVDEISEHNWSGNIIPPSWFKHITFPDGAPHPVAIVLLSDIIYWYRAFQIRDEVTGYLIETKKKFKSDKLQKRYSDWSAMFGWS